MDLDLTILLNQQAAVSCSGTGSSGLSSHVRLHCRLVVTELVFGQDWSFPCRFALYVRNESVSSLFGFSEPTVRVLLAGGADGQEAVTSSGNTLLSPRRRRRRGRKRRRRRGSHRDLSPANAERDAGHRGSTRSTRSDADLCFEAFSALRAARRLLVQLTVGTLEAEMEYIKWPISLIRNVHKCDREKFELGRLVSLGLSLSP
ncbi:hypothetical protein EYF80_032216 [Liparis tanakae]|uniref:Uncharacterized protein n=1 Tax=Liparis tanakae TaxID=230148 RepID=A0A4Z2GWD0_9TELE|nr:hypothetical protein EYF80_032216 [Liparis tanakae]